MPVPAGMSVAKVPKVGIAAFIRRGEIIKYWKPEFSAL